MTIQSFNAWSAAATGFKYLPYSLVTQAVTITGAIAIGQVAWDTVKEALFPSDSKMCDAVNNSSLLQKVSMLGIAGFTALNHGAGEEVIVRGIFQDGLLTRVPKAVLEIFGRNHWVDSRPAQVVRVGISAAAFAAMHLVNSMSFSPEQVRFQIANTLGLGIAAAAVKEKTGSVLAAMGLHSLYNALLVSIPNLWLTTNACSIFKSDPTPMSFSSSPSSSPLLLDSTRSTPEQSISLDQKTCPMESIFTYPTCSSKNSALAKEAEIQKDIAEYYRARQEEHKEKAESLLQLAQSPYPVEPNKSFEIF